VQRAAEVGVSVAGTAVEAVGGTGGERCPKGVAGGTNERGTGGERAGDVGQVVVQ
jgi:hypothetical protein